MVFGQLSEVAERVYPSVLPLGKQDEVQLPAVTYQRVSTLRIRSHDGTSLLGPLYQITCWDSTSSGARALGRDVIDLYEPMIGLAYIENHLETFAPEQKLFAVIIDVRVWEGSEQEAS